MQGGKKDHFVPQGYLRHFATDESRASLARADWKVHTFSKQAPKLPVRSQRIDAVAYSNYFERYGLDELVSEEIRKTINKLENLFFTVQAKLVETEDLTKLEPEALSCLILYTAFQRERPLARRQFYKRQTDSAVRSFDEETQTFTGFRTTIADGVVERLILSLKAELEQTIMHGSDEEVITFFKRWNFDISVVQLSGLKVLSVRRAVVEACGSLFEEMIRDAYESLPMSEVAQGLSDLAASKDNLRNYHLAKMFQFAVSLAEDLKNCAWVLHKNRTSTPFWTSDNPVVCYTRPSEEKDERVTALMKSLKTLAAIAEPANLREGNGKINETFDLLFPISPDLLLRVGEFREGQGVRMSRVEVDNNDTVAGFNYFQFAFTTTNLYSDKPEFERLSEMPRQTKRIFDTAMEDLKTLPEKAKSLIEERAGRV